MGQKVHPIGIRLGINKKSGSEWIPANPNDYKKLIQEDKWIRSFIPSCYPTAKISKIFIERYDKKTHIKIVAISFEGTTATVENQTYLKSGLESKNLYYKRVQLSINSISDPTINAQFLANSIVTALQKRRSFKWEIKKAIQGTKQKVTKNLVRRKVKGIRIQISGRLNGAEMARIYWVRDGQVPLHTLRADIDYLAYPIQTRYGILGLKIWICNDNI